MEELEIMYELTFKKEVPHLEDGSFTEDEIFEAIMNNKPLTIDNYYNRLVNDFKNMILAIAKYLYKGKAYLAFKDGFNKLNNSKLVALMDVYNENKELSDNNKKLIAFIGSSLEGLNKI